MAVSTISYGGRNIPCRPRESDEFVLDNVFDAILPELAAVCGWDVEKDMNTVSMARAEFLEAARSTTDGYEIMCNLEQESYWDGNARLVEIFKAAPFRECLCEHVQKWIDYFSVEPLRKIGDTVTFLYRRKELRGVIEATESLFEPGMYVVCVDDMKERPLVRWEQLEAQLAPYHEMEEPSEEGFFDPVTGDIISIDEAMEISCATCAHIHETPVDDADSPCDGCHPDDEDFNHWLKDEAAYTQPVM